jgi:hypothetical protein
MTDSIHKLYLLITPLLGGCNGPPIFLKETEAMSRFPTILGFVLGLLRVMGKDEHLYGLLEGYITLTGFFYKYLYYR